MWWLLSVWSCHFISVMYFLRLLRRCLYIADTNVLTVYYVENKYK